MNNTGAYVMEQEKTEIVRSIPGLLNAYPLAPDVVTAGQPREDQIQALADAGIRTVLDLRAPAEPRGFDQPEAVRQAGMEYVNLPVAPGMLNDETFDRFRDLMRDPSKRPMLVHCASANRVGAVLIPYLVLDEGKAPEEALEIAAEVGLRSRPLADVAFDYVSRAGAVRSKE